MLSANRQRYGLTPLFIIGVLFLILAPLYWLQVEVPSGELRERTYENASLYEQTYPMYAYGFERLQDGDLPLWNPWQMCGTPFMANPNTALFQPLNMILLILPVEQGLAAHAFLSLIVMALTFVLFARVLGLGYLASLFGAIAYAFSGVSAAAMSRPELASAMAWAPLLFWAMREGSRSARGGVFVVGGVAWGLVFLSGSLPAIVAISVTAMVYGPYCIPSVQRTHRGLSRTIIRGFLQMVVIALGLGAVQWVPTVVWWSRQADP